MKLVAGMATMKGREAYAKIAKKSLEDCGVEVNVYNNDVMPVDYTDNAKFYFLQEYKEPVIYFSVDDDIFYTSEYVKLMVNNINRYNCILTIHGRKIIGKGRNYYKGHKSYRCLGKEEETTYIDVPGTGVTVFNTEYFNPTEIYRSEYKRMSDLVFGLEAAKSDKKILHLKHDRGLVRDLKVPKNLTIYYNEHKNCKTQSQLADEIFQLKGYL